VRAGKKKKSSTEGVREKSADKPPTKGFSDPGRPRCGGGREGVSPEKEGDEIAVTLSL